jgi:hypothetical protein
MFKQVAMVLVFGTHMVCIGFTLTPVRNIITTQAFSSSLINNINQEFISDGSVMKDLFQYHYHIPADILYTSMFMATLYYQLSTLDDKKNWEDIALYQTYRRRFNMLLMFMFVVFVRNIDNAI